MTHIEILKNLNACEEAVEWAKTQPDLETAWANCPRSDWMLWLDDKMSLFTDSERRLMACAFVRRTPIGDGRVVWDLLADERSRNAVVVAERYARGEATDEELFAARSAAWHATLVAASDAACAARGAASAARDAACAARVTASEAQADIIREWRNPFTRNEELP